jgi:hypothetical protein
MGAERAWQIFQPFLTPGPAKPPGQGPVWGGQTGQVLLIEELTQGCNLRPFFFVYAVR